MWVTLITTAMAASVCLSVVNLASQINKVRDVRHAPIIEFSPPHKSPDQSPGASTVSAQKYQKGHVDPGA
jgi:hypothetical protein